MTAYEAKLAELLHQEEQLQFHSFSFRNGVDLGLDLMNRARSENLSIVVEVYAFGQQLFFAALPGTRADNPEWVKRKRNAVLRFAHSSFYLGNFVKSLDTTIEEKYFLTENEYCAHGGSFPILLKDGGVIGAVTVSGLAQEDDHAMVVAALRRILSKQH